eukprot:COSAG06_NODE_1577_length_9052_cov_3.355747_2_plen_66_part_00
MVRSSDLDAGQEYGLMWNVAITSDLDKDDPKNPRNGREQGQATYLEQGQSARRRGGRIHPTLGNR